VKRKYLIDTAIWIDLYEDRVGYNGEPLGDYAWQLLALIRGRDERVVVSDLLLNELESRLTLEQIRGMFSLFETIIERRISTESQWLEAERLARERNVPPGDALHAIIARDGGFVLVTRDRHFNSLLDISPYLLPEDLNFLPIS
jgi:predicted nucleic acid-binding protein